MRPKEKEVDSDLKLLNVSTRVDIIILVYRKPLIQKDLLTTRPRRLSLIAYVAGFFARGFFGAPALVVCRASSWRRAAAVAAWCSRSCVIARSACSP